MSTVAKWQSAYCLSIALILAGMAVSSLNRHDPIGFWFFAALSVAAVGLPLAERVQRRRMVRRYLELTEASGVAAPSTGETT